MDNKLRKIWHVLPESFRENLDAKTPFQKTIMRLYIRKKGRRIRKLHNIAKGKRIFVIGNGPSLSLADLEMIRDEDSFASNYIFKCFEDTSWRPKYYALLDYKYLQKMHWKADDSLNNVECIFINGVFLKERTKLMKNEYPFYSDESYAYNSEVGFSDNVARQVYDGMTVTYSMIQLAVYMGYSEIYLIGVDHNYTSNEREQGKNENYMAELKMENRMWANAPQMDKATKAYEKARDVCEKKGIVIKNLTRGGKLEVFVREELENVISNE